MERVELNHHPPLLKIPFCSPWPHRFCTAVTAMSGSSVSVLRLGGLGWGRSGGLAFRKPPLPSLRRAECCLSLGSPQLVLEVVPRLASLSCNCSVHPRLSLCLSSNLLVFCPVPGVPNWGWPICFFVSLVLIPAPPKSFRPPTTRPPCFRVSAPAPS